MPNLFRPPTAHELAAGLSFFGVGFGRRSFILGSSVAGERHPICGKASMIVELLIGSLLSANSAPSLAGLFVSVSRLPRWERGRSVGYATRNERFLLGLR